MATKRNEVQVTIDSNFTASDLRSLLDNIDDSAKVSVYISKGDRPFDSSTEQIKFIWTEEL